MDNDFAKLSNSLSSQINDFVKYYPMHYLKFRVTSYVVYFKGFPFHGVGKTNASSKMSPQSDVSGVFGSLFII